MLEWQQKARRVWRTLSAGARNAPLVVLTVTVSLALEAFGWGYIFLTNRQVSPILGIDIPLALIEATIISASGMLALVAAFVAAERRIDPRSEVRKTAGRAQLLAVALLVGPTLKAADGFAYPQQVDARAAFRASDTYREMLAASQNVELDSMERAQARANLERGERPARAVIDGTWIMCLAFAAFLYGCNMAAASLLWRAAPEKPAERERRERREARERREERAQREHEAELARLRAKGRPKWVLGVFSGRKTA